ncbi:MAG: DUF6017 domain-containing protein [Clostridiales bacterium]|nr:DUF6017 domain-containing protein [Clostridiales bacterium]
MAIIKFKVSRDRCYTVVNNTFINDNQLDAREKGLLLVLMSKPDHWDMSIEGLRAFCADGTTALRKGIQKLEEHGYLLRLNARNTRGNFGSMSYVVFERPLPVEKRTNPDYNPLDDPELNEAFDISHADRTRWLSLTSGKISTGHRVRSQKSAVLQPSVENQPTGYATTENRAQINTVIQSTVTQKKNVENIPAIAVESYPSHPSVSDAEEADVTAASIAVHERPPIVQSSPWSSVHENHLARTTYTDGWIPPRSRNGNWFDGHNAFDAFMQSARRSQARSRYSPDEYSYVQDLIKERISYEAMCQQYGAERVNTVVDILMEINCAVSGTFRVEGVELSAGDMKSHFAKVNQFHVERMFANLDQHTEPIRCMKSYMRTTLYNVIITMDEEIRAQVRQDHPWLFMKETPAASACACA